MTTASFDHVNLPSLTARGLTINVPLDAAHPQGKHIDVFARIYTAPGGESLPYLLFLQGGPGSEAPRATETAPSWVASAVKKYQVVMLDQRGTGRSTPIGSKVMVDEVGRRYSVPTGVLRGMTSAQIAQYLTHLRADEIVNDCEAVRKALGIDKWTVLGQSFGGFTALTYLSKYSQSLTGAIFTGGLSAVGRSIDEVYATTWAIMKRKSEEFYQRYPTARERVRELLEMAKSGELRLANGDLVSPRRLRSIGCGIGMAGGFESLNYTLDLPFDSPAFTNDLAGHMAFRGRNPIYSVLHESCYADGGVTNWAAARTMPQAFVDDETLLSGEHMSREMVAEDLELSCFRDVAEILAQHEWPRLYDEEALRNADVPVVAAIYANDAYVPREYSEQTAALLPCAKTWVTADFEHNGLRCGTEVIDRLFEMSAEL